MTLPSIDAVAAWSGQCVNLTADGWGILTLQKQDKIVKYIGDMHLGKWTGSGSLFLPNGATLIGRFVEGKINGPVVYLFSSGARYYGDWNKSPDGQGVMQYPDSSSYAGSWHEGTWSGEGVRVFPNGDEYIGGFNGRVFSGAGTLLKSNGDRFQGLWDNNTMNGPGEVTTHNGSFQGNISKGLREGYGKFIKKNGDRFEGFWKEDKPSGPGSLIRNDGKVFSGNWEKGCLKDHDTWVSINSDTTQCGD